jgi:hypothetical protein
MSFVRNHGFRPAFGDSLKRSTMEKRVFVSATTNKGLDERRRLLKEAILDSVG